MSKESVFRKKSLEKLSELDQLNSYLKVTGISAWIILAAAVMVVICIYMWGSTTRIADSIHGAGMCENGTLTCYFRQEDMDDIKSDSKVRVNGEMYEIQQIVPKLLYTYEVPREILYLSQHAEWYQTVLVRCDLPDGTYNVSVELGTNTPLGLMTERE